MGASATPSCAKRRRPTKGKGAQPAPKPEINVTPLVDVVLVLLIIFMVIAPALNDGEHIDLPSIVQVDKKKKEIEPIEVSLVVGGKVLLDKSPIDEALLEDRLRALHADNPDRGVMLKADVALPYKRLRDVFSKVQDIGFRGVSLNVRQRKES